MISPVDSRPPSPLRAKAAEMEAAFLAEMLGPVGMTPQSGSFGGGIGEDQFGSFLREAQAKAVVKAGGIGLTEALFRAMGGQDATG